MTPCEFIFLENIAIYLAGFLLGAGAAFFGFRSYYKELYQVKR